MNRRPEHHLNDETLVAYAAGTLERSIGVLVASHLTLCPDCRKNYAAAEALGGALLDQTAAGAALRCSAVDVLAKVDNRSLTTLRSEDPQTATAVNDNAQSSTLPRAICELIGGTIERLSWRWMGPGVKYAFLGGDETEGKVGLMRIAAGTRLPRHGHTGEEFTMVLAGGYSDDGGQFARGDVEWADFDTVHQPRADKDGECLCLVVTKGTLKATGFFAPLVQPLMSI